MVLSFDQGIQSSTLRSYVSAVKHILTIDGYWWRDEKILLNTLVNACKIRNDVMRVNLPIHISLLEILLFEIECKWDWSPYIQILYKTVFLVSYYGFLRISEVSGIHVIKAKDVHIASNKNKIMLIL